MNIDKETLEQEIKSAYDLVVVQDEDSKHVFTITEVHHDHASRTTFIMVSEY